MHVPALLHQSTAALANLRAKVACLTYLQHAIFCCSRNKLASLATHVMPTGAVSQMWQCCEACHEPGPSRSGLSWQPWERTRLQRHQVRLPHASEVLWRGLHKGAPWLSPEIISYPGTLGQIIDYLRVPCQRLCCHDEKLDTSRVTV